MNSWRHATARTTFGGSCTDAGEKQLRVPAPAVLTDGMDALRGLTRKPERGGDRSLVDEVFDGCLVATVSTVIEDEPWSIPVLVVRDGDRLLLHGSTGAGALRHIAGGAKAVVSAFLLDGLVIAERQFDHSANYRSAVVRGTCRRVPQGELAAMLDRFTDTMLPGRPAECPAHTAKELAQTMVLEMSITQDNWVAKKRTGPPAVSESHWTGIIPVSQTYGPAISESAKPVPASVQLFIEQGSS